MKRSRVVYEKLRDALPRHQQLALALGYYTGMRLEEVLSLQWSQVDFEHLEIRLKQGRMAVGSTNDRGGRVIPIYAEMETQLKAAAAERDPNIPWVITYRGNRITRMRDGWDPACEKVGVPQLLFHDLRRSAAMNLDRAGVPLKVAMEIIGHKTDAMWKRYRIVESRDIVDARHRMNAYFAKV